MNNTRKITHDEYVIFYNRNTGKELISYSKKGTFVGELKATLELLAYENHISASEITIKTVKR